MFSRLRIYTGALAPVLRRELTNRNVMPVVVVRASSSVSQVVKNWEKANEKFYGPQRDVKNFPHPTLPEKHPPTRLGVFPASWFQALYDKTGVTGPYVFGTAVVASLLSTELWVVEHHFTEFLSFWLMVIIIHKKWGSQLSGALDKYTDEHAQYRWYQPIEKMKSDVQNNIKQTEDSIQREEGQKFIFETKRESVALQLEAEYRQRLETVYKGVKKRLDYQIEIQNTKRRFEQGHMVDWIVNNVVKSITPQQERESISVCIKDLKAIAAR